MGDGAEVSKWNARASRKNRYSAEAVHVSHASSDVEKGEGQKTLVEQRLRHPHTQLKVHLSWDVSWWVAVIFVLGSTAWVRRVYDIKKRSTYRALIQIVNGFYLFLPLVSDAKDHQDAASWWAFVGGTLFEVRLYTTSHESPMFIHLLL